MKHITLTLTILILISINTFAQKYKDYLDSAELKFSQEKYFDAYQFYKAAKVYGKNIPSIVAQSEDGIEKSIGAIEQERITMQKLLDALLDLLEIQLPSNETDAFEYIQNLAEVSFDNGDYDLSLYYYDIAAIFTTNESFKSDIERKKDTIEVCIGLIQKAADYIYNFDFEKSIEVYEELKILNPNDPRTYYRIEALNRTETQVMWKNLEMYFVTGNPNYEKYSNVMFWDFKVSIYEVTNMQFALFLIDYGQTTIKDGDYKGKRMIYVNPKGIKNISNLDNIDSLINFEYKDYPILNVTWFGAYEFCRYYGLNLPSSDLWEFVAKGGDKTMGFYFSGSNNINDVAWNISNSNSETHPVGNLNCNELGVYDMSGNVWEWCSDVINDFSCNVRGGSFEDGYEDCNILFIDADSKTFWNEGYYSSGFRPFFIP